MRARDIDFATDFSGVLLDEKTLKVLIIAVISLISKNEAINLMQNAVWPKKWNIIKHKNLLSRIRSLHTILPKTSAYVKSYEGQSKWMYFLIEDNDFKARSVLISTKNLTASLSIMKNYWKPK